MTISANRLNSIIHKKGFKHYLKIGVQRGHTFLEVNAESMVAVDPKFLFDYSSDARGGVEYYEMTSDSYFFNNPERRFDLIFIDGLHTYEQSLRDLINSISLISDNGVIVIDDVFPNDIYSTVSTGSSEAIRLRKERDPSSTDGRWHGDVFKTLFFVSKFVNTFSYWTTDPSEGNPQTFLSRAGRKIEPVAESLRYETADFLTTRQLRKLYNFRPFSEIIQEITTVRLNDPSERGKACWVRV